MNINNPTTFGTPNLTLSTSNSSGTGGALRADDTVLVYDSTAVDAITFGQSGNVGSASTASRRDHAHAMAADPVTAAAGASLVLIGSEDASDDDALTVTGLSSVYDSYLIVGTDLIPETDTDELWLRVGDSNGVDEGAGDYMFSMHRARSDDVHDVDGNVSATKINITPATGNATGEGTGFSGWLTRPGDGTVAPSLVGVATDIDMNGVWSTVNWGGYRTSVITLDRIQILMSTGEIKSGRLTVWGVKHA